nr:Chain P, NATURALLY PROCESSED OCTAPEPTIDE PBM1 [synthetic construct]1NAN_M Chain M, pBM1 peptide [synthetic construct]1NAN_Q Chain Q, pBM1 peptide [synthetic construct]2CLZ_C Chain C, RBM5 PROTEIN [Mus musculus]2CLZ_M Chain M, RBM5 PROTEIN [Mus musculus]
INFDFNTI